MKHSSRPAMSLRVQLILSYLGVALGAILVLVIVIAFVVQNYFYSTERDLLRTRATFSAREIVELYSEAGNSWDFLGIISWSGPDFLEVADSNDQTHIVPSAVDIKLSNADVLVVQQALQQALHGQEVYGGLQGSVDGTAFSGQYVAVPVYDNGRIIGAMLLAEPQLYPQGFSPNEFLVSVNQAILITSLGVALVVFFFSLMLAHKLTRPLTALTAAAEQMKRGKYSERVTPPANEDELGRLAQTFNAMADTIEADITELHRQEQVRRDLIANIAHDLITPLTTIQGLSEALADDVIHEPKARQETAQLIGREVQRLRRLVGDMQQMSSLESEHFRLDLAPLDVHELVDEMLAVIGPECEQAGISLHNEIAPTTPLVLADGDRITQVLLNLLDNARRHTPEGGALTVGARVEGENLAIWVSDTGAGIDPADLPHIFDRFYRADRARSGSTGGSGLGLSIVKAIITAHGGTIHAESTPGEGTCILFTLPLAPSYSPV
jgi:two-component system sensor histidine kinase BaeS